jgi:hypothetical protein
MDVVLVFVAIAVVALVPILAFGALVRRGPLTWLRVLGLTVTSFLASVGILAIGSVAGWF